MRRVKLAAKRPERVAGHRLFDFDDIGAKIGEHHPGGRAGNERAHFENLDVGKWQRHQLSPLAASAIGCRTASTKPA